MNNQMLEFARSALKKGLATLSEDWQMTFKRMYSHDNLNADINDVIDNMPEDKLDWAMRQVENSLAKGEIGGLNSKIRRSLKGRFHTGGSLEFLMCRIGF